MTEQEYSLQMNRLVETFGKQAYGRERANLIWAEVKTLPRAVFENAVSGWIGDSRTAPMLKEIREVSSAYREESWKQEKAQARKEVQTTLKTVYGPDDRRSIFAAILKRMNGEMKDQEFEGLLKALRDTVKMTSKPNCYACDDVGYLITKEGIGEAAAKCKCWGRR